MKQELREILNRFNLPFYRNPLTNEDETVAAILALVKSRVLEVIPKLAKHEDGDNSHTKFGVQQYNTALFQVKNAIEKEFGE